MAKLHHLRLDLDVIQLTEPTSIHEAPDYLGRCVVGGVTVTGNRASSALGAAQSLLYTLTGAGAGEKAQEATIGLSLALAGSDLGKVAAELDAERGASSVPRLGPSDAPARATVTSAPDATSEEAGADEPEFGGYVSE